MTQKPPSQPQPPPPGHPGMMPGYGAPYMYAPPMMYNPMTTTMYTQQGFQQQPFQQTVKAVLDEDSEVLVAKFFLVREDEARRIKVSRTLDYDGVFVYLRNFVGEKRVVSLKYEDEDGDWINVNTPEEWVDCMTITTTVKSKPVLKLKVLTEQKKKKRRKRPRDVEEEGEVDGGISTSPISILPVDPPIPIVDPDDPISIGDLTGGDPTGDPNVLIPSDPDPDDPDNPVDPTDPKPDDPNPDDPADPVDDPAKPKGAPDHTCDHCSKAIFGPRYHSPDRQDFDLCVQCWEQRKTLGLDKLSFEVYLPGMDKASYVIPAPTEPKIPQEYQTKLQLLQDMGFHQRERALELLKKHNGDLQAVVREFLKV